MTIDKCCVTSATYMRHLCSLFLADNWLWMVLPVAVCAMLALLYFYYGLSPEARWSIMEKTVTLSDEGLVMEFTDQRMKKHAIGWDDVRSVIEKDDAALLMLAGGRRYTCLMLPASAVDPDVAQLLGQRVAQPH